MDSINYVTGSIKIVSKSLTVESHSKYEWLANDKIPNLNKLYLIIRSMIRISQ